MKNNNVAINTLDSFFTGFWHLAVFGLVFGLVVWMNLLHWYFGVNWLDAYMSILQIPQNTSPHWRAIFGLCLAFGLVLSAWLHTWLHLRGHLKVGDKFNRGARVVESKY